MGAEQAKPRNKLDEIDREVAGIRSSIRTSNTQMSKENRDHLQKDLIKYSNEVSALKGKLKSKQLDSTQKTISETMREVLTMDSELDKAAVETDSFIALPQNRRSLSLERTRNITKSKNQSKSMPSLINSPTLEDVDNKLKTLRAQIKVALESEDTTQLRVHKETLKVLATSLELIDVPEFTPLEDKKKKLDATVTSQYQKVVKSLKEIRRNKDIKYLNKQKKKDDNMKELEIIKREIDKYDSLSRKAFKDSDTVTIKEIQEKINKVKQRLSSIECVDDNDKTFKLQMKDQVTWLDKYITEYAQKGSQSDLTKAQAYYEDIIKTVASGKSQNDLTGKLESLQNFTYSISSQDEDNDKKKQQLLNNINDSLITLVEAKTGNGNNTIDNELLEKYAIFEDTMLRNFEDAWRKLENVLHKPNFSKEIYCHVDSVLNEVQYSIMTTRKTLENLFSPHTKLNKKLSSSVPNLVEKETLPNFLHSMSGGSEAVHSAVKKLDPVKATSLQVSNEHVHLRNKHKSRKDQMRFSRINEIKTQVYYIKEKFESSIQKPNLKTKLEAYVKTLEECSKSENQVIANNAKIILADVQEIIKNIDRSMAPEFQKLPLEYYSDILTRLEDNVLKVEKSAKNIQAGGNDGGLLEAKTILNQTKESLQIIDIPPEYESATKHRLQIVQKIDKIFTDFDKEFSVREENYVREVKKSLDNLKESVNRFSSPYKGVLYNAIEKDLNRILVEADANITNKYISDQITRDTEKFLKILEQRASKDQSLQQSPKREDNEKMSAIKEELQAIKNDIDSTPMNATNNFVALNSRLDLIKLTIDQLKNFDENIEQQKEIIYNEIETLKNVVTAKIVLGQQDINQTSLEEFKRKTTEENNKRVTEELDKIELTFEKLKKDITNFVGTRSDKKYYELDESTMRLNMKLDDLKLAKETPFYERKVKLLNEIRQYENLLDKRTVETEHLTQFERDVSDMENNFSRYTKSTKDIENLAERVKLLIFNLNSSEYNSLLRERKTKCLERMNKMENTLKDKAKENCVIEENLIKLKYKLELLKTKICNMETSVNTKENLLSIKTELENMTDLNNNNLQQRTELLKELASIEKSLSTKYQVSPKSRGNTGLDNIQDVDIKIDREMSDIDQKMRQIKKQVQVFVGTTKDEKFCELDEGINKLIIKLDEIIINRDSIYYKKKVELMKELQSYSEQLDKRVEDTENICDFEQELVKIQENKSIFSNDYIMQKVNELEKYEVVQDLEERKVECVENYRKLLKEKQLLNDVAEISTIERKFTEIENTVHNFVGTSSDSAYININNSLQILITDVEKFFLKDPKSRELVEKIESTRSFLRNKGKENKIYSDFMKELSVIENQINNTSDRNAIVKVHNKLKFIQSDAEKSPLKEMLKNEVHRKCTILLQRYSEKLNSLPKTNYIGSTDFLKDLEIGPMVSNKPALSSFDQQFEKLSNEISQIELKVEEFKGDENTPDYKNFEDELLKLNVRVKKLNDLNKTENTKKKLQLKEKVVNCLTKIDEKVQDFEILTEIEREFDTLNNSLQCNLSQKELDAEDERLISLQLRLGKLNHLNKSLSERKNKLIQKIMELTKVIKVKTSNSNSEDSGTSI